LFTALETARTGVADLRALRTVEFRSSNTRGQGELHCPQECAEQNKLAKETYVQDVKIRTIAKGTSRSEPTNQPTNEMMTLV